MPTIVTSTRRPLKLRYRHEVPSSVLSGELDWLDSDTDSGFFKYGDNWYHLSEFLRLPDTCEVSMELPQMSEDWTGYHAYGISSGVVVRLLDDGETFVVGQFKSYGTSVPLDEIQGKMGRYDRLYL